LNDAGSANAEGTGADVTGRVGAVLVSVPAVSHGPPPSNRRRNARFVDGIAAGRGLCFNMQHALEKFVKQRRSTNGHNCCRRKFLDQQLGHFALARWIERVGRLRQENPVGPMKHHAGKTEPLLLRQGEHRLPILHHAKLPGPLA